MNGNEVINPGMLPIIYLAGGIIVIAMIMFLYATRRKKARFVLHPGNLNNSKGVGPYFTFYQLIELYKLNKHTDNIVCYSQGSFKSQSNDIHLHPLRDGNYVEMRDSWLDHKNLKR